MITIARIKNRAVSAAMVAVGAIIAGAGAASANVTPDPSVVDPAVEGAISGGFQGLKDLFLENIALWMFVLAVAIVGVTFAIRKMRQSTKG